MFIVDYFLLDNLVINNGLCRRHIPIAGANLVSLNAIICDVSQAHLINNYASIFATPMQIKLQKSIVRAKVFSN